MKTPDTSYTQCRHIEHLHIGVRYLNIIFDKMTFELIITLSICLFIRGLSAKVVHTCTRAFTLRFSIHNLDIILFFRLKKSDALMFLNNLLQHYVFGEHV